MSTATIEQTVCPSWCLEHSMSDADTVHIGRVTVGSVSVELERLGDGDPEAVMCPEYMSLSGQDLRDYAAALAKAADLLEAPQNA